MTERCDVCGFEWDAVSAREVASRVVEAADLVASVLREGDEAGLRTRPHAATWSAVEYGAHVRDVFYNIRDRIVVGLVEDTPRPKAMYGAARADLGLYAEDEPVTLAAELELAARLFARTVRALEPEQLARTIVYGWPREAERSLRWVAAQAVHEAEHHAADVARVTAPTRPTP
jgi:DinB superfamily